LSVVLLRQVKESDVLLKSFEQPLFALAHYVRGVLDGDLALKELVRQADVEWGRVFDERRIAARVRFLVLDRGFGKVLQNEKTRPTM
jgi:hypothetical protein